VQQGIIPDLQQLNEKWTKAIQSELERLNLTIPNLGAYRSGAKQGLHTEHLGYVLAEMQSMQRSYPDMVW
jgi:ring-1,2-phenylacetyl-CoA epoxidase subunit PaaC